MTKSLSTALDELEESALHQPGIEGHLNSLPPEEAAQLLRVLKNKSISARKIHLALREAGIRVDRAGIAAYREALDS